MIEPLMKRLNDFYSEVGNTRVKRQLIAEIFRESSFIQELTQQLNKVEVQIKDLTCKKCNGTGKVSDKYIEIDSVDWPWDNYYTKKSCPICKGAGIRLVEAGA